MSQILNLELSDDTFAAIQQQAKAAGTSPVDLVVEILEKQYRFKPRSEEEKQKAQVRFENHFGEIDLGHPTGVDNERIDEDLASTYVDTHEAS